MACILHIETAAEECSVAVSQEGAVIYHADSRHTETETEAAPSHKDKKSLSGHAGILGTLVDEALSFTDNHAIPFDAVAVSAGPGSYTGLRVGVSMAKGICYGRDLKLIALPTPQIQCVPFLLSHDDIPEDSLICPMLDARRMEVYTALYTRGLKPVIDICAKVIDEQSFLEQLAEHPIYFMGNGAPKCKAVISHPNAHFVDDVPLAAKYMSPLAERKFLRGEFEDVAYFEPNYLKEWTTTHKDPNS
ncbi:MAG: tRNA (adenosine(37)-N6)-threonylcarbamoyltransferase complex dimerization subunit type 1 TsaB [Bacteroidaceae bacterium]|nr:tRNA (adenosine(37)-N6)-threonylcarbamoyltransferase complex dimerization subunit type 1 TsaB [Bacteroidaceae bacterium]